MSLGHHNLALVLVCGERDTLKNQEASPPHFLSGLAKNKSELLIYHQNGFPTKHKRQELQKYLRETTILFLSSASRAKVAIVSEFPSYLGGIGLFRGEKQPGAHLSNVLKPLHLKVGFGRKYRFQHVDFPRSRKRRARFAEGGFSIMYSLKLRGRATIQSRNQ